MPDIDFTPALDAARIARHAKAALILATIPFARLANIIDALPHGAGIIADDQPLQTCMPAAWPTVGDARKLRDELVRLGWKP